MGISGPALPRVLRSVLSGLEFPARNHGDRQVNRDPLSPPSVRMPIHEALFYAALVGFIVGVFIGVVATH